MRSDFHDDFEWLLYSILVAGKKATFAQSKVGAIRKEAHKNNFQESYDFLKSIYKDEELLENTLRSIKTGKYRVFKKAFKYIFETNLNHQTASIDELEKICGVGMKTARMYLSFTREYGFNYAVLDVHILNWMRRQGIDAPYSTPSSKKQYLMLEQEFLKIAKRKNVNPLSLDRQIWLSNQTSY